MLDRSITRLEDGLLAGFACFIASSGVAQESFHEAAQSVSAQSAQSDSSHPLVTQVLVPIITGLVVPFLKEWLIDLKEKRKERRKKRKHAVSEQS